MAKFSSDIITVTAHQVHTQVKMCPYSVSGQRVISELNFIVYSFTEVVPFLLSLEGAKFVLTKKFNQENVQFIL